MTVRVTSRISVACKSCRKELPSETLAVPATNAAPLMKSRRRIDSDCPDDGEEFAEFAIALLRG